MTAIWRPALCTTALVLAGSGFAAHGAAQTGDFLVQARGWVIGRLDSSRPHLVPSPADRVVVVGIGREPRILYEARPDDLMLSTPVVSRDGSMVAFSKAEGRDLPERQSVYILSTAGGDPKRVIELRTPSLAPRGAETGLTVAWSHDNAHLAFHGLLPGESGTPPGRSPPEELQKAKPLRSINLLTGAITELGRHGRWVAKGKGSGVPITSQAWAPDNRRLVYANDDDEVVIVDVATKTEISLGPGTYPAWSPDGRSIVVRVQHTSGNDTDADYVSIATDPPHERTVVLSHRGSRRSLSSWLLGPEWFAGPILWSPDGRTLLLRRVRGERETTVAINSTTGAKEEGTLGYRVFSIGGRP